MDKRLVKLCMAGLFASLSIIAFTIENLIPPIFIPGAKLGFSNVFILLMVKYQMSPVIIYPGVAVGGLMITTFISLLCYNREVMKS